VGLTEETRITHSDAERDSSHIMEVGVGCLARTKTLLSLPSWTLSTFLDVLGVACLVRRAVQRLGLHRGDDDCSRPLVALASANRAGHGTDWPLEIATSSSGGVFSIMKAHDVGGSSRMCTPGPMGSGVSLPRAQDRVQPHRGQAPGPAS